MKLPKLQYWCAGCGTIPADAENAVCHCSNDGMESDFRLFDAETCSDLRSKNALIADLEAENKRLRDALEDIADEQKIYKGHGDFDIEPALTAVEAQSFARAALQQKEGE